MLRKKIEDNIISEKDYFRVLKDMEQFRRRNYGYAFVTFTHADEAKLTSILMDNVYYEGLRVRVVPKMNIDHRNLDRIYTLNHMKN